MKLKLLLIKVSILFFSVFFTLLLIEFILQRFYITPTISSEHVLGSEFHQINKDTIVDYKHFHDSSYYESITNKDIKIVALGDSFTWGFPVNFKDTYPSVLESLFNSKSIAVLNMGLGDSGPDQHLKVFQKYVLSEIKPDIVIWQFYPNDTWDNLSYPLYSISDSGNLKELDTTNNWLYKREVVYKKFSFLGDFREKSLIIRWFLSFIEKKLKYNEIPQETKDWTIWGRDKIAKEIKIMNQLAVENNFEVYFILIAPQSLYDSTFDNEYWSIKEYHKLYKILSLQKNFIDIDFTNNNIDNITNKNILKIATNSAKVENIFLDETRDPNPYGDRHFNELGYALMAELIYKNIEKATPSGTLK